MAICPICRSAEIRWRLRCHDDRYGCPGEYDICRCEQCAHAFLPPGTAVPADDRLYADYYPRADFELSGFSPKRIPGGLSSWLAGDDSAPCRWVPPGSRVLDVGCGMGEALAYLQTRGCDAYGVEIDENARQVVETLGFNVRIGPFDPDDYPPEFFDCVILQQVVEHFADPVAALRGVATLLRPGGTAIISTPNAAGWGARVFGRRWIHWHVPYHRHFFSRTSMAAAARDAGLTVESARTATSSAWLGYQWIHLAMFPVAGEPSAFWSPHGERTMRKKIMQKIAELPHHLRLNHLATRLLDGIGIGDNLLFLLRKPRG